MIDVEGVGGIDTIWNSCCFSDGYVVDLFVLFCFFGIFIDLFVLRVCLLFLRGWKGRENRRGDERRIGKEPS